MKPQTIIILLIGLILLAGCAPTQTTTDQDTSGITNLKQATLDIEGMFCASCSIGVQKQFEQIPGVIDAAVSLEEGKGYVTYDADKVDAETIAAASDVYSATVIKNQIE